MNRYTRILLMSVVALGYCGAASAATVLLDATDAGFVTEMGGSAKGDGAFPSPATYNYSVGRELHYSAGFYSGSLDPMDKNNYLVFDLSSVTDPIIGAKLHLPAGELESPHPTETWTIVAPSDPGAALADAAALLVGYGIGPTEFDDAGDPLIGVAAAMYGNIAGGPPPFASIVLSSADDFSTLVIELDPGGVGYLNAFLGGEVILGGSVSSVVPPDTPQQPFGGTGPDIPGGIDPLIPKLEITTIPEPATMTLLAVAGAAGLLRRRRR